MFKLFHRKTYSRTRLRALWNEWRYKHNTSQNSTRSVVQLQAGEDIISNAKLQSVPPSRTGPDSTTSSNHTSTPVASPLAKAFNFDTSTEAFSSITDEHKSNSEDSRSLKWRVRTHTYTAWIRQWKTFTRRASQTKKSARFERMKSRYRKLFTYKLAANCEPTSQLPVMATEPLHVPAKNGTCPFDVALPPIFTSSVSSFSSDNVPKAVQGTYEVSDNWASNIVFGGEEEKAKAEEHVSTDFANGYLADPSWFLPKPDTLATILGESAKFACFCEIPSRTQSVASASNPYLSKNLDDTPPALVGQHLENPSQPSASAGSSILQDITSAETIREPPITQCSMRMKRKELVVQYASQTSLISPTLTSNRATKSEVKSSQNSGSKRKYLKRAPTRIASWFSSVHQKTTLKPSSKH